MQPREEEVRRKLVNQWLQKADQDMRAAEALLSNDPPLLYVSCFHSQQAAEKYLKAFLVSNQINFPKTHDIQQLLDLIESVKPALARSLDRAIVLTEYAAEVRYPGGLSEPDGDETRSALRLAEQVRDTILEALPSS